MNRKYRFSDLIKEARFFTDRKDDQHQSRLLIREINEGTICRIYFLSISWFVLTDWPGDIQLVFHLAPPTESLGQRPSFLTSAISSCTWVVELASLFFLSILDSSINSRRLKRRAQGKFNWMLNLSNEIYRLARCSPRRDFHEYGLIVC